MLFPEEERILLTLGASFSKQRTGNIVNRRLLVNLDGPEIQTEFYLFFLGENDWLNSEKGGIYESPPANSSPANSSSHIKYKNK